MLVALLIFCILLCAAWIAVFAYLIWSIKRLPVFASQKVPVPDLWPRLSVVVPACNEAPHLESAALSLAQQDYPDLEIVLVDDRSTDDTGEIIDRLAHNDPRIRAVHVETLPSGWLGKVHALHRGVAETSGDWLLFTDADVHFSPGALRRAIAFVLHQRIDHLALIPRVIRKSFWLEVAVNTFALFFFITTRAAGVNRPGSKAFVGIGAFNLVNAEAFRRTPGFEWLRLEPGDDVALGFMLKRAGAVTRLAFAQEELSVQWYPSVAAMFKGLEKNLFGPASHYQWWLMILQVGVIWALVFAPPIAILLGLSLGLAPPLIAGAAAISIHLIFSLFAVSKLRAKTFALLLFPAGMLLITFMMLRAGYKCLKNNGIDWRGTHYPLEQLRAGQRIKF
jgi:cellulose synthase/poly-beta-1,6-N-acetylglucosamine synthase-like glycosyltransferase